MNDEEYKSYITSIIKRLIHEKCVYPKIIKCSNSNKIKIKILINMHEWYHELDDDTKYNVEYNLQNYIAPTIIQTIKESMNKNDKE